MTIIHSMMGLDCIKCTSCPPYDEHLSVREHKSGKARLISYEGFLDLLRKQTSSMPYAQLNSSLLISCRPQIILQVSYIADYAKYVKLCNDLWIVYGCLVEYLIETYIN